MSVIEIRLKFAREHGHSLDTVNRMAEKPSLDYVQWLEKQIEKT